MGEHRITTLIDQYLLGTISPEDRSLLEQLILSDPSVSKLVRESESACRILQHEKNRRLKEKLRGLDKDELMHQGVFSKPIGWLTILLLALIAGLYLLAGNYSHTSIALQNAEAYLEKNKNADEAGEDVAAWTKAQNAFLARDFGSAIQHYLTLSEAPEESKAYLAKWNILLAQLAIEGPTPTWKMSLDTFTKSAPEPLRSKAVKLSSLPDSFLYRLFHNKLHEKFSSIKPRLI